MKVCNLLNLGITGDTPFYMYASNIWTDGNNIYCSQWSTQKVLIKGTNVWIDKVWHGMNFYGQENVFYGEDIWTDGTNIYYIGSVGRKVLDVTTDTWVDVTFEGIDFSFYAEEVWTDGVDTYFSASSGSRSEGTYRHIQKKLNKATRTWSDMTWNGIDVDSGEQIFGKWTWSDGNNIYLNGWNSIDGTIPISKVLNVNTHTWTDKTWHGMNSSEPSERTWSGDYVWNDGEKIYMSLGEQSHIIEKELNKSTSTWINKTWNDIDMRYDFPSGGWAYVGLTPSALWTDGVDIYYSNSLWAGPPERPCLYSRKLNRATNTWEDFQWYTISSQ